jgi:Xaa-Pro dipeptidase
MNRRKEEEEDESTQSEVDHLFSKRTSNQETNTTSRIYQVVQTILFSYSFLVTILLIIFISLFFWQLFKIPIPLDYEQRLNIFRRQTPSCKNVGPIQKEEYSTRRLNLVSKMTELNLDAIIMEPSSEMIYFTGIKWKLSERPFLFVVTKQDEFFICPTFELRKANETINNQFNIYTWNEDESPYEVLKFHLKENKRISISKETRIFIQENIKRMEGSGITILDQSHLMDELRMIKSTKERDILNCANVLTKAVHYQIYTSNLIKVGMKQSELTEHVRNALEAVGLTNIWSIVLFGKNAAFPHGTKEDASLVNGDFILIDIGGSLFDYQSDITRTYNFPLRMTGGVNEKVERAWKLVQQSQQAALNEIKPGKTCGDIDRASRKVIDESEWGTGFKYYQHRLGHGIGIQGHEDPYFVGNSNVVLKKGMMLSVEPGIYVHGEFGIRIEDIIMVTEDGYELFGGQSKNLTYPIPIY